MHTRTPCTTALARRVCRRARRHHEVHAEVGADIRHRLRTTATVLDCSARFDVSHFGTPILEPCGRPLLHHSRPLPRARRSPSTKPGGWALKATANGAATYRRASALSTSSHPPSTLSLMARSAHLAAASRAERVVPHILLILEGPQLAVRCGGYGPKSVVDAAKVWEG